MENHQFWLAVRGTQLGKHTGLEQWTIFLFDFFFRLFVRSSLIRNQVFELETIACCLRRGQWVIWWINWAQVCLCQQYIRASIVNLIHINISEYACQETGLHAAHDDDESVRQKNECARFQCNFNVLSNYKSTQPNHLSTIFFPPSTFIWAYLSFYRHKSN